MVNKKILKIVADLIFSPPAFLRKKIVTEDGYKKGYGDIVFCVTPEPISLVLAFKVGDDFPDDFLVYGKYENALEKMLEEEY